jgi:hypothetical protein
MYSFAEWQFVVYLLLFWSFERRKQMRNPKKPIKVQKTNGVAFFETLGLRIYLGSFGENKQYKV